MKLSFTAKAPEPSKWVSRVTETLGKHLALHDDTTALEIHDLHLHGGVSNLGSQLGWQIDTNAEGNATKYTSYK